MDYEKKYKEALERAKYVLHTVETAGCAMHKDLLTEIFPELAESEDERIRRTLVEYFGPKVQLDFVRGIPIQKIRDWLEKQKERAPVERSREDNYIIGFVYALLNQIEWKDNWAMSKEECLRRLNNYIPQKPAERSEEDDMLMDELESYILYDKEFNDEQKSWRIKRLKSLRPDNYKNCNSRWKPSKEQMKALEDAFRKDGSDEYRRAINSLYQDLKKL